MKKIFQNYLSSSNPIFQNKSISEATQYRNQNIQGCMKECAELFSCNQIDKKVREMAANFIANSIKANNQQGQLLWSYISPPLKQSILICALGVIANGSQQQNVLKCSGYGIIEQIKWCSTKNKDQINQIIWNRLYISFGELSQKQDGKRIESLKQIIEITNTLMQYAINQKDIGLYLETLTKIICQSEHKQQIQFSCKIVKNIYKQFKMGYNFNIFSISDSLLDKLLHLLNYNKCVNLDFIAQAIVQILEVLSASPLPYKYMLKLIDILKQYPKFGTIESEDKSLRMLVMLLSIIMGIMHNKVEQINICQQIYQNVILKFCHNQHGFNVDAFHILSYMTLYLKKDQQAALMVWETINQSLDKCDNFQLFKSIMNFLQFLFGDLPSQYPKIQKQILSKILNLLLTPNFNVQYHSEALKGIGAGLINRVCKEESKKLIQILLLICSSEIDKIYGQNAEDMKDSIIESITTLVMVDYDNKEMRSIVHNAIPQFVQFVLQQLTSTSKQNYSFVNQCCSFLADLIITYPQSITKYNKQMLSALKQGLSLLKQKPQKYKNNIEYIEKAQQRLI